MMKHIPASSFSGCMYAVGSGSVNFFRYPFRLVPHWDVYVIVPIEARL